MSTCQLIALDDDPGRVLLDLIPLESLHIDGTVVPRGLPLSMSFQPSDDAHEHREMISLFERWLDRDGLLELDVAPAGDFGGFRYVFTRRDEQLVLDVRS